AVRTWPAVGLDDAWSSIAMTCVTEICPLAVDAAAIEAVANPRAKAVEMKDALAVPRRGIPKSPVLVRNSYLENLLL
ncbi:hypothetical protein NY536_30515, partial [Enterobacter hormaechei]|nr:hypothetical protein [Enterobacter hormaechei]